MSGSEVDPQGLAGTREVWRQPPEMPTPPSDGPFHSLLERVVTLSRQRSGDRESRSDANSGQLDQFLKRSDWRQILIDWVGAQELRRHAWTWPEILQQIDRDLARIDAMVDRQLNLVLHAPAFQKLEASWRGLQHLVVCRNRQPAASILIKVLNLSRRELERDFERAVEFDQSHLFQKVYEQELGTAGGVPYSTLLFDYDVCPKPSKDHPFDDIATLRSISQVGAAAFAPCFLNASPTLLGIDEFDELTQTLNVEAVHEKADFIKWRDFRDTEDSRFISLALPRILMRQPYRFEPCEEWGFAFREKVHSRKDYLWGGAVYGVGEVLIRSFGETGWFAKIKGWSRGEATGGLVLGPARDAQPTESLEVSGKPITETLLGDSMEKQLNRLGLMAICPLKLSSYAAFLSAPSVQKPRTFATAEASANAEISSMTNYLLCASRFAHCIRLMAREKIGSVTSEEALQQDLSNWLVQYKSVNDDPSLETRADKPLLDARVEVTPKPGRPGEYDCVIWLQPIHGFDDVRATLKLETQLSGKR